MTLATAPSPFASSSPPASADAAAAFAARADDLAVYIHWPFCKSKCPYCDFNSHVAAGIDQARWRRALLTELDHGANRTRGARVVSLFFGGGTPSLMDPETAGALIEGVRRHWVCAPDLEITLEANPTSVEAGRFEAFAAAGVNRVSLGVQALDDDALKFLGRGHSAAEALKAIAMAARLFRRFSFDLIYGRPGQARAHWRTELGRALDNAGEHLSLYQLTIEPGTAFDPAWRRGDFALPDDDLAGALFEDTQEIMERTGRPAYEISNHARPGAECRHNLVYWRSGAYLGIGPGAHGRLGLAGRRRATRSARAPETWLKRVEAHGHGLEEDSDIAPSDRLSEVLMMGLRLTEGIARHRFRSEIGDEIEDALDPTQLNALIAGGFIIIDDAGLRATAPGRQRLNAVLGRLIP
jgi:oxygen-independent coproporphyrinogen-3 oxidase